MRKRKRLESSGPNQSYLISFGDTMTALLAFFIVINTMAQDQTGAKLYSGTGSFAGSLESFGLGVNQSSGRTVQHEFTNPLYVINDDPAEKDSEKDSSTNPGTGPDSKQNNLRVIERQRDQLRRFLIEMEQMAKTNELPKTMGATVFDFFEPIQNSSPKVSNNVLELVRLSKKRLAAGKSEIEIIVWSRTPGKMAWKKSVEEASEIRDDLISRTSISPAVTKYIKCQGKPWFYTDHRRPRFSIVVRKYGS